MSHHLHRNEARHGGSDAIESGHVVRRADHSQAADGHRLQGQGWLISDLHRGVEHVHVHHAMGPTELPLLLELKELLLLAIKLLLRRLSQTSYVTLHLLNSLQSLLTVFDCFLHRTFVCGQHGIPGAAQAPLASAPCLSQPPSSAALAAAALPPPPQCAVAAWRPSPFEISKVESRQGTSWCCVYCEFLPEIHFKHSLNMFIIQFKLRLNSF